MRDPNKTATYLIRDRAETSRGHVVLTVACECGTTFRRRPKRWQSRGWTRCPRCGYKLIYE